jgi:hypothetical protein
MVLPVSDVPERLAALIDELTGLGSPIGRYVRPGSAEDEVRAALDSLRLGSPAELIDWFGRQDGPDDDAYQHADPRASPLELFPGVRPLPLDEAVSLCVEMRESSEGLGPEGELFWRSPWFPILVGPGSTFAVECPAEPAPESAVVWRALSHPGPSETGIVASTVAELLERWLAEIRAGNVYWHADSRSLEPGDGEAVRLEAAGLY